MKKMLKKLVISVIAMAMLCAVSVEASESSAMVLSDNAQTEETILLPAGTTRSVDEISGEARGTIISSATSEIIDKTGGDIGVLVETLCHVECSEIRHIIILERLDEENNNWVEVTRYDFSAKKEDFPNTPLTSLINDFTIENQETGYYYRIRGIHQVTTLETHQGQVYSTRTNGLLITDYGR